MKRWMSFLIGVCLLVGVVPGCGTNAGMDTEGMGLSGQLSGLLGQVTNALNGVTDVDSAQAVLPDLQSVDHELSSLAERASAQSQEAQDRLSEAAMSALPDLETLASKVTSIGGVDAVLGSTLDSITGKLAGLI
jgi:hypothetical protein